MKAIVALFIWTVVLAFMSLMPVYEPSTYRFFDNEDKVAHVIMYLIMAFLIAQVIVGQGVVEKQLKAFMWSFLIPSLYGYLMEILQGASNTGRQFDKFDIIANIIGSFTGTMLFYMLNTSRKKDL